MLTGDIHTSWAADLHPDPGNPATYDSQGTGGSPTFMRNVGVEFVTPSVTSANFEGIPGVSDVQDGVMLTNPHIKFVDLVAHGYNVLDVTADRVQSDWYAVDTVLAVSDVEQHLASWYVDRGTERVVEGGPVADRGPGPAVPAPVPAAVGPTGPADSSTHAAQGAADHTDLVTTADAPPARGRLAATGGGATVAGVAAIAAAAALRTRSRGAGD